MTTSIETAIETALELLAQGRQAQAEHMLRATLRDLDDMPKHRATEDLTAKDLEVLERLEKMME